MKKFLKGVVTFFWVAVVTAVVLAAAGLIYLSASDYSPEKQEELDIYGSPTIEAAAGDKIKVMTFNIGSGILTDDVDYYTDGGSEKRPGTTDSVNENMNAIAKLCTDQMCHVNLFQQADIDSTRSHSIDEASLLSSGIYGRASAFAADQKCAYVPFPVTGFVGKVDSGLLTLTRFEPESAQRIAFDEGSESWPKGIWSKKPCFLVSRTQLTDSTKELVVINVNFTQNDDGTIRQAQYKELCEFMQMESAKGNYVIAGGNFSAALPSVAKNSGSGETDVYTPCELTTEYLTGGWKYCTDDSTATMRLVNKPYSDDSSVYCTDGFITSPNTIVENTKTIDTKFKYSNHNPVTTEVTLVK